MPFCGFNSAMLQGLREFARGLFEQAIKRSGADGISIEQSFEIEIEEMNIFLAKLKRFPTASCSFNPQMSEGLAKFAQALYQQSLERSRSTKSPIEQAFETEVGETIAFFTRLDDEYYKNLRPKHGANEAIEQLMGWIASYPK